MLPSLPPQRRPGAAVAYLDAWGDALTESARAALASKVLATIDAPELAIFLAPTPVAKSRWPDCCLGRGVPTCPIAAVSIGSSQPARVY